MQLQEIEKDKYTMYSEMNVQDTQNRKAGVKKMFAKNKMVGICN